MSVCTVCKKDITKPTDGFTTGYGTNDKGEKICYPCCAKADSEYMRAHDHITLYLTGHTVTNWPGSLSFPALVNTRKRGHNWGLSRRDCWFQGPHGNHWWGVSYGDWTELVHCKKLKHKVPELINSVKTIVHRD